MTAKKTSGPVERLLRSSQKRISKTNAWCTGNTAEDSSGHEVPPKSKKAARFCAIGALQRSTADDRTRQFAENFLNDVSCLVPFTWDGRTSDKGSLIELNDFGHFKHRGVMLCYNIAIEMAKETGF